MARGSVAKVNVINQLKKAFGENFIGEVDKKIYVWADDGGEPVQIALALTCPKTFVEAAAAVNVAASSTPTGGWDFENMPTPVATKKATVTEEEKRNIADIMARLGL